MLNGHWKGLMKQLAASSSWIYLNATFQDWFDRISTSPSQSAHVVSLQENSEGVRAWLPSRARQNPANTVQPQIPKSPEKCLRSKSQGLMVSGVFPCDRSRAPLWIGPPPPADPPVDPQVAGASATQPPEVSHHLLVLVARGWVDSSPEPRPCWSWRSRHSHQWWLRSWEPPSLHLAWCGPKSRSLGQTHPGWWLRSHDPFAGTAPPNQSCRRQSNIWSILSSLHLRAGLDPSWSPAHIHIAGNTCYPGTVTVTCHKMSRVQEPSVPTPEFPPLRV